MLGASSMAFACTFVRAKFKGNCTAALPLPLPLPPSSLYSLFPLLALFSPFISHFACSLHSVLILVCNLEQGSIGLWHELLRLSTLGSFNCQIT